jgi:chorismate mutase / prephenate dehydrogenase
MIQGSPRAEARGRRSRGVSRRAFPPAPPSRARRPARLRIAIVGGSGSMGRWLARYFERRGAEVGIVDPRVGPSGRHRLESVEVAARWAGVIVFATPIGATRELLRIALASGTNVLIFDVLSVKSPILSLVRRAARSGANVTSIHPLFGPSTRSLVGRNLLVLSCGNPNADRRVRSLFSGTGLVVSQFPIHRHDRLMAETLGLAQVLDLLFLRTVASGGRSRGELARSTGTSFRRHAALARILWAQRPELTVGLQALNPSTPALLHRLRQELEDLSRLLGENDVRTVAESIERGFDRLRTVRLDP